MKTPFQQFAAECQDVTWFCLDEDTLCALIERHDPFQAPQLDDSCSHTMRSEDTGYMVASLRRLWDE